MDGKIKDICFIGAGGVGGYFSALMMNHFKSSGTAPRISLIARGKHLEAIKTKGLELEIAGTSTITVKPFTASDNLNDLPAPDLCFICTKSYDLENMLDKLSKVVKPDTIIIPLLNGISICERIKSKIKNCVVLPGWVFVVAGIDSPGKITAKPIKTKLFCGPDESAPGKNYDQLKSLLSDCGINFQWCEKPQVPMWEKFIFIASFALVTAAADKAIDQVLEDETLYGQVLAVIDEINQIASAQGIELPEDIADKTIQKARMCAPNTTTSFQRDVKQKGDLNEQDIFATDILKMAKKFSVPTPVVQNLSNCINALTGK